MKKNVIRIFSILIIFIMLFEIVFSNGCVSYASTEGLSLGNKVINMITDLGGGLISILLWIPKLNASMFLFKTNVALATLTKIANDKGAGGGAGFFLTPYDIFFNKFKLLDINYFDFEGLGTESLLYKLRSNVAGWFYAMRLIAVSILFVILIYVGIRMALSTVADEKAKYKKMLFDWCSSLALIFVIQYIAIFTIYANNAIVNALDTMFKNSGATDAIAGLALEATLGIGLSSLAAFLVYVGILAQTIFFFISYINRMIKVGFLLIISPLITVTYAIDKMGDGKAQALGNWLKEYIYTILIQPFHCIIYMAFINTAFELIGFKLDINKLTHAFDYNALAAAFLAILCIKFVTDGEKVVRKIFGFSDDNKSTSLAAGAIATVAFAKQASKVGKFTKSATNSIKLTSDKFSNSFMKDFGSEDGKGYQILKKHGYVGREDGKKTRLEKLGGKFQEASEKTKSARNKYKDMKDSVNEKKNGMKKKIADNKIISGFSKSKVGKFAGKQGQKISNFAKEHSTSLALAAISGMAAYVGGTDAMTAYGIAYNVKAGTSDLFGKTSDELIKEQAMYNNEADEEDKKNLDDSINALDEKIKDNEKNLDEVMNEYEENDAEAIEKEKEAAEIDKKAAEEEKKAQEMKKNGTGNEEVEKQNKKAKELRKEASEKRKKARELRGKISEQDEDGKIKKYMNEGKNKEEIAKEIGITSDKERLEKLNEKSRDYFTEESMIQRAQERQEGINQSDLNAQINEIQSMITDIIRKRRGIDPTAVPENGDFSITPEDKLGKKLTTSIENRVKLNSLTNSKKTPQEILGEVGLYTAGDKDSELLSEKLAEYQKSTRSFEYAKSFDNAPNIGLTQETYGRKIGEESHRIHSREERKKS